MTPFVKIAGVLVLGWIGISPAMAANAAGDTPVSGKMVFIENPNPNGRCLKILIPGIRCPILAPAH